MKRIGIVGGMGAAASVRLYDMIIKECQRRGAVKDSDFPEIWLHNMPALGMNETGVTNEKLVIQQLNRSLHYLKNCGVEMIAIACNSVHYLIPRLQKECAPEIINMVELATNKLKGSAAAGIICSQTSLKNCVYSNALHDLGITELIPAPDQQEVINKMIGKAISGKVDDEDRLYMANVVKSLYKAGADNVLLGCTEIPLLYQGGGVIDPYDALIEELLK